MRKISTRELRELEVVNLCTGEKLGYPTDFEIDIEECKILSIIITLCEGLPIIGKRQECVIPWCKIECIGEDTILVKLSVGELPNFDRKKRDKCRR